MNFHCRGLLSELVYKLASPLGISRNCPVASLGELFESVFRIHRYQKDHGDLQSWWYRPACNTLEHRGRASAQNHPTAGSVPKKHAVSSQNDKTLNPFTSVFSFYPLLFLFSESGCNETSRYKKFHRIGDKNEVCSFLKKLEFDLFCPGKLYHFEATFWMVTWLEKEGFTWYNFVPDSSREDRFTCGER